MSTSVRTQFVPVRNPAERFFFKWFFALIPGVYGLRLGVQYAASATLPYALLDSVKIASELAILLSLTLANQCLVAIRPTIASLFSNGVVSTQTEGDDALAVTQARCERSLDRLLNHRGRFMLAASVAFTTLYYYVSRMGSLHILESSGSLLYALDLFLYFVPTVCYAYFVGTIVWRLFVTSWFFQRFPERYVLIPRFQHPDGACGFLPLGDLCLRMMYVAVIPTVLSGLFILGHFVPSGLAGYLSANTTLLFRFVPLILGLGIIGLVISFLPLFRFHIEIITHNDEWTKQLTALAERIIAEKTKILRSSADVGQLGIDSGLRVITELQAHYEASRNVRMWPVDGAIVARIWGSVALMSGQMVGFIETVRKLS